MYGGGELEPKIHNLVLHSCLTSLLTNCVAASKEFFWKPLFCVPYRNTLSYFNLYAIYFFQRNSTKYIPFSPKWEWNECETKKGVWQLIKDTKATEKRQKMRKTADEWKDCVFTVYKNYNLYEGGQLIKIIFYLCFGEETKKKKQHWIMWKKTTKKAGERKRKKPGDRCIKKLGH